MFCDTHCHLNFPQFAADLPAILERAAAAGVARILIPAIDIETSLSAIALAEQYPQLAVAIGIHPNSVIQFNGDVEQNGGWMQSATLRTLRELAQHPSVCAIGEIGLDYHWDTTPPAQQAAAFAAQLALAAETNLPVVIHCRDAHADTVSLVKQAGLLPRAGVFHSFGGSLAEAQTILALGFYLGFTGPVTFSKSVALREVVSQLPLARILLETDAPYLTPHPKRGQRNEPAYLVFIAEKIAAERQTSLPDFATASTQNANTLFGW